MRVTPCVAIDVWPSVCCMRWIGASRSSAMARVGGRSQCVEISDGNSDGASLRTAMSVRHVLARVAEAQPGGVPFSASTAPAR